MEQLDQPLGESEAVSAIASLLEGPDDREPEEEVEVEEPQAEAEEETEAQAEETEEVTEEKPEEFEEITWNGETKKLSKTELKELAQQGFDYTQKTQRLAHGERQLEAERQAFQQSVAIQNQQIETVAEIKSLESQLARFKDVDWHQFADADPVAYLKAKETFNSLKEAHTNKVQTFHQAANQLNEQATAKRAEAKREAAKKLVETNPNFRGEKGRAELSKAESYLLKTYGYTPQDIEGVTDHRPVDMAWKAMQWDALQASKPALNKRVADAPKPVKAGPPKSQNSQADKSAYDALRKTGRGEYAAKLIEKML
jgi:hypothetical protein